MALAVLVAAGVSCCPPVVAPVVVPCPRIALPPKPRLPIQDYKPEWTKDEVLRAMSESVALLNGWGDACAVVIKAHNEVK
jgi:hypothetical protein